jgi:hypothetical protein
MSLEELEQRKKELELKRDIAKLERNERLAKELPVSVGAWSWMWVAPLTLVGLYFLLLGLADGKPPALVLVVTIF